MLGSAGVQPQEQLSCFDSGASVVTVMALMMALSVLPTYTYKPVMPGAMPSAWVMSRICSVSSQSPPALLSMQLRLVPSVEMPVTVGSSGLSNVAVVGVQIRDIVSQELKQANVLGGASQCRSAVVGRAHVAA